MYVLLRAVSFFLLTTCFLSLQSSAKDCYNCRGEHCRNGEGNIEKCLNKAGVCAMWIWKKNSPKHKAKAGDVYKKQCALLLVAMDGCGVDGAYERCVCKGELCNINEMKSKILTTTEVPTPLHKTVRETVKIETTTDAPATINTEVLTTSFTTTSIVTASGSTSTLLKPASTISPITSTDEKILFNSNEDDIIESTTESDEILFPEEIAVLGIEDLSPFRLVIDGMTTPKQIQDKPQPLSSTNMKFDIDEVTAQVAFVDITIGRSSSTLRADLTAEYYVATPEFTTIVSSTPAHTADLSTKVSTMQPQTTEFPTMSPSTPVQTVGFQTVASTTEFSTTPYTPSFQTTGIPTLASIPPVHETKFAADASIIPVETMEFQMVYSITPPQILKFSTVEPPFPVASITPVQSTQFSTVTSTTGITTREVPIPAHTTSIIGWLKLVRASTTAEILLKENPFNSDLSCDCGVKWSTDSIRGGLHTKKAWKLCRPLCTFWCILCCACLRKNHFLNSVLLKG